MPAIYQLGVNLIIFLQGVGDWIFPPMIFFTSLGIEEFYLLVVPVIYWCVNPEVGVRTGMMLILSSSTNNLLKWIFRQPRPYWVSSDIRALASESSFGLPSGHAQNAVAIWGVIAHSFKERWIWIAAIFLMVFIGISRPIIGVHFPQDTLLGWGVGLLLLFSFTKFESRFIQEFKSKTRKVQISICAVASILLILISALVLTPLENWTFPQAWLDNIQFAFPNQALPHPLSLSPQVSLAGVFFGLSAGYLLLQDRTGLNPGGKAWQLVLRYLIGALGVFAIWFGLDQLFPDGDTLIPYIFRYIRYGLVGVWVAYFAPVIFIYLNLAEPSKTKS